jgi:glycosyltransferase involved in cell wall biosynthesis
MARPLSLLFLNQYAPPDEAATAQILGDLVERAAGAGHACRVVAGSRGYADPSVRYPLDETRGTVQVSRVPLPGLGRARKAGRALDYLAFLLGALVRALASPRPDVVISLSTPPILGLLGLVVARVRGARAVYWVMDLYPELAFELGALRPGSIAGRLFRRLSRFVLSRSDLVVALGETMESRLRALGATRTAVVHNWADGVAIRPGAPGRNAYRRERGWDERFVVLYSGNLGLAHEFDTLLDAAERLRSDPEVVFAFVGSGPRRPEVESAARRLGLENVQVQPGVPRERLGESLTAADVHVVTLRPRMPGLLVPSKAYGILAAGVPLLYVGPPEGEVHEIVTREGCGFSLRPGDAGGLLAALSLLRNEPLSRRRMGAAARAAFERSYTREGQTERLIGLVSRVAAGEGGG